MKRSKLKTLWRFYRFLPSVAVSVWAGCWREPKLTRKEWLSIGLAILIILAFGDALNYLLTPNL